MSKDQKQIYNISEEKLKKLSKNIYYILNSLEYWGLDRRWPTNLIYDTLKEISDELFEIVGL